MIVNYLKRLHLYRPTKVQNLSYSQKLRGCPPGGYVVKIFSVEFHRFRTKYWKPWNQVLRTHSEAPKASEAASHVMTHNL